MSDSEARLMRAKGLLESGKGEEARLLLLELLKEAPNNITALLMLGGEYFTSGRFGEAELVYERLVGLEPGSGIVSIALFNTLIKQGRFEEAADEIRRFITAADRERERATLEQYARISQALADGGADDPEGHTLQ